MDNDLATNGRPAESVKPAARRAPRHTSKALLHEAIDALGIDSVAAGLRLSVPQIEAVLGSPRPMTLSQQRVLAVAVLVMTGEHPRLRRRAATLLGQVGAAEDYMAGITARHAGPPRTNRWP